MTHFVVFSAPAITLVVQPEQFLEWIVCTRPHVVVHDRLREEVTRRTIGLKKKKKNLIHTRDYDDAKKFIPDAGQS
jgi:hypothetical protein